MSDEQRWVSKSKACALAGISWPKLERLIRDGHVKTQKSVRRENVTYVDLIQLRAYLAQDEILKA